MSEYPQQEGSNSYFINLVCFRLFTSIAAGYFQVTFSLYLRVRPKPFTLNPTFGTSKYFQVLQRRVSNISKHLQITCWYCFSDLWKFPGFRGSKLSSTTAIQFTGWAALEQLPPEQVTVLLWWWKATGVQPPCEMMQSWRLTCFPNFRLADLLQRN